MIACVELLINVITCTTMLHFFRILKMLNQRGRQLSSFHILTALFMFHIHWGMGRAKYIDKKFLSICSFRFGPPLSKACLYPLTNFKWVNLMKIGFYWPSYKRLGIHIEKVINCCKIYALHLTAWIACFKSAKQKMGNWT